MTSIFNPKFNFTASKALTAILAVAVSVTTDGVLDTVVAVSKLSILEQLIKTIIINTNENNS